MASDVERVLHVWFHEGQDVELIEARVAVHWEWIEGFPFPREGWLQCPFDHVYRSFVLPRLWRFFEPSGEHTVPRRVDVGFKCWMCSATFEFGIPVPRDVPSPVTDAKVVRWREAKRMIEEAANAQG